MNIHYSKRSIYRASILIGGFAALAYSYLYNPPKDRLDNVYENHSIDHPKFPHVHLKETSNNLGINYVNPEYVLGKREINPDVELISPSISVVDINNDSFMDIFITTGTGKPNLLYINQNGLKFKEEAAKYGLAELNKELPVFALWADFNQDGLTDLLLAKYGCHSLLMGDIDKKFKDKSELLNGYCSNPNGVNVADFYNNGRLDIIFANFLAGPSESKSNNLWMANTRYDNRTGGKNHLLKNTTEGFVVEKKADYLTRSYSHSAGINDVNNDGYPDIFFSNDYAHDEMFINNKDGSFIDVTDSYIPKVTHGLSGMNAEFFDYNNDGLMDLYVTNIYKPPFNRHFNLLWQKKIDNTFENVSQDKQVAKCGFSWAAKFVDIDNDGEVDLPVMNGRSRSASVKKMSDGKSMWYERIEVSQIPLFVRKYYQSNQALRGRYISAFERKCLFMQKNGHFYDVANSIGFTDREENRALALIDYDNDGRMDLISAGGMSRLKIYHNETVVSKGHHWIGFTLIDKRGNSIPHGAHIKFSLSNGKTIYRELYPANGHKAFSDSRFHIGLGASSIKGPVEIYWPDVKKKQYVQNVVMNQYNEVREDLR